LVCNIPVLYCFPLLTNIELAPTLVPENYTGGFVGLLNYRVYYSESGSLTDWSEINNAFDSTVWQAWGVAYGDNQWVIKLGSVDLSDQIASIVSSDGYRWSEPLYTGLTANKDFSIAYCSASGVNIK
jgi:hypothetical protein